MPEAASPPPCRSLGRQCRELGVVLRIADLADDTLAEQDALATWLLGHTERLTFGKPFRRDGRLMVEAVIAVDCKYLKRAGGTGERGSRVRCRAHGYEGPLPIVPARAATSSLWADAERALVVQDGKLQQVALRPGSPPHRSLPVLHGGNPCVGAPCRTADNKRGAACCRDLTIDVVLEKRRPDVLALLRSRRSPYLCKVTPDGGDIAECEVISRCGYLESDDITCSLHDRVRPDGAPAKPFVCSEWPGGDYDGAGHPGCRLLQ